MYRRNAVDTRLRSHKLVTLSSSLAVRPVRSRNPPLRIGLGHRLRRVDLACEERAKKQRHRMSGVDVTLAKIVTV